MDKENTPVLTVPNGSTVIFETWDAMTGRIVDETGTKYFGDGLTNPCTGPLYVEGAEVGDVLKVDILDIKLNHYGFITCAPGYGAVGDMVSAPQVLITPIEGDFARFDENTLLPLAPMIGTIGTAPSEKRYPCQDPGPGGSNMDITKIKPGSTVYLPVFVKGGLLSMGDVHAVMGDGEVMGSGSEIAADITVRVEVLKENKLPGICVVADDTLYTVASAPTLERCSQIAVADMVKIVMDRKGFDHDKAGMYCGAVGDLHVCQIVNAMPTVRFGMPLKYLK
ncbi:MAG: acetamidase/formamidase family protein [Oscillospiraceae bacterium]|nr:acetamidase/formamidase family protein [Oscillospiraceae bacterium]